MAFASCGSDDPAGEPETDSASEPAATAALPDDTAAPSDDTAAPSDDTSDGPTRGGTLRVGIQGSSSTETNNPIIDNTNLSDGLRRVLLYDSVSKYTPDGGYAGAAAGSWEYADDLSEVRFDVREGAAFHDGEPVTAADIAYSMRLYSEQGFGAGEVPIDWDNVSVDGNRVVAPLLEARTDVAENLAAFMVVVKDGTTDFAEAPIGSGPFKLDVFEPGTGIARLVRNDDYPDPVYLDAIEIRAFEDRDAMTNAFLSGEIDVAINVGGVNARLAEGRDDVVVLGKQGALHFPFIMRMDEPPFDDPDVRLALKLAVDRQALVDGALQGQGAIGNDLFQPSDPDYNDTLPQRTRDVARAIELLEGAGFTEDNRLDVTLYSSDFEPAMTAAATLFVEQLNSELPMVDAQVVIHPGDTYWSEVWLVQPFMTGWMQTWPLTRVMLSSLGHSEGDFNETSMANPDFDTFVETAVVATDPDVRREAMFAAQEISYNEGGYIVWGFADEIDLARPEVKGLPTAPGRARYALWQAWLDE